MFDYLIEQKITVPLLFDLLYLDLSKFKPKKKYKQGCLTSPKVAGAYGRFPCVSSFQSYGLAAQIRVKCTVVSWNFLDNG